MGLGVFWTLDLSSLLDEEGEVEVNGCCCPKDEHSWMKVDRPIGYDGGLAMGLIVGDGGSLGSWLALYSLRSKVFVWSFMYSWDTYVSSREVDFDGSWMGLGEG